MPRVEDKSFTSLSRKYRMSLLGKVIVPTISVFRDLLSNEKEALMVQNQSSFKVLQGIKGRARFLTNFRVSLALGYSSMTGKRPPKSVVFIRLQNCGVHHTPLLAIRPCLPSASPQPSFVVFRSGVLSKCASLEEFRQSPHLSGCVSVRVKGTERNGWELNR